MWEYMEILCGIMSVPHNVVMDVNNVMYNNDFEQVSLLSKTATFIEAKLMLWTFRT